MKNRIILILNFILILLVLGVSVKKGEEIKKSRTMILELMPIDPRSLMQGDYMILRFELERGFNSSDSYLTSGYIETYKDSYGVSRFLQVRSDYGGDESISFRANPVFNIGIDSYFFQEGKAMHFEQARYARVFYYSNGKIRLDTLLDRGFRDLEEIE